MLHIRCGDDIREKLNVSGVGGDYLRWADPLCQGPVQMQSSPARFREMRARFIAENYGMTGAAASRYLADQDEGLESLVAHDEVVLWFEHDLFDQIILIHLLQRIADLRNDPVKVSLICIGTYPGIDRFQGLAQLEAAELEGLFRAERREVSEAAYALARRAWAAFTHPDPGPIQELIGGRMRALPFLRDALLRHLAEFPDMASGLSRTERFALEAVAMGERSPRAIFAAVQAREEAPWLSEKMFWLYLTRLLSAREPLLGVVDGAAWQTGSAPAAGLELGLTRAGDAVLAGRADAIWLNGINRWVGGVQLLGDDSPWRYDESARQVLRRRIN
jgi:hypothetical protein